MIPHFRAFVDICQRSHHIEIRRRAAARCSALSEIVTPSSANRRPGNDKGGPTEHGTLTAMGSPSSSTQSSNKESMNTSKRTGDSGQLERF
jgi:hypothetical protein